MNTFITQSFSITKKRGTGISGFLLAFLLLIVFSAGLQSWKNTEITNESPPAYFPEANTFSGALSDIGAWDRLSLADRLTLSAGGTVTGFDPGICNDAGGVITTGIASGPASGASDPTVVNARQPRRWGNTSFYLGLKDAAGSGGVEYCFTFDTPVEFNMDSREHAYFAEFENIRITAQNAGVPVMLSGNLNSGGVTATMTGNGTTSVLFSANGKTGGGTWWSANSNGQFVTAICITYYLNGPAAATAIEPFKLKISGSKCVADNLMTCGAPEYISRWNQLGNSQRMALDNGLPVFGFNTGFCDETGDPINFIEIEATPSEISPSYLNNKPPRPYGRFSLDNGREYIGAGGNTYCFTLDEALPFVVNSLEHSFFAELEFVKVSAFLGADPVILTGSNSGVPVMGTADGIMFSGSGYGAGVFWEASSGVQPVSQICVEYFQYFGATLGREPFAIGICADRCVFDDHHACEGVSSTTCQSLPRTAILKEVNPVNDFGLNTCNNASGGIENPVYEIRITMFNTGGPGLKQLWLDEDLQAYFSAAYIDTVTAPQIVFSSATATPLIDPLYDGRNHTDLFIPGTGGLQAGEEIVVAFTVELDPDAPGPGRVNRVYGGGIGNGGVAANDLSGGNGAGFGDPTSVQSPPPGTTTELAQDLTLEATLPNFMNGINPWLADNGGADFTMPDCDTVTWTNDYDPANWVQGCGMITGSIEVTFTATNNCGFVFTTCASFTLEDTKGPTCTKPDDLVLDCNDPNAQAVLDDWLAYDGNWTDLSQPVTFTNDFMGLDSAGCNGDPLVVTWTAEDACGNQSFFSAELTVVDNTAPVLQDLPADLVLDACNAVPDPADVTATDACDPDVEVEFEESQTGDACDRTISRAWTATDDCGNTSAHTQTIRLLDDDPPVFTNIPVDTTVECPDIPPVVGPDVADCSAFTVEFEEIQIGGACPLPSQIIRTWTATDDCGNVDSVTQVINVLAPFNPGVLTWTSDPQDITVTCDQNPGFDSLMAETTCPTGGISISFSDVVNSNGDCSQPFSVTRTWIAHDDCGNLITETQTISIGPDTSPPVFASDNPTDLMVDCGDDLILPVAFDNCGPTELSHEDSNQTGDCTTGFTFTRTWTATDLCGNTSTFSQNITTSPDMTPPVFLFVPYDQFFDCDDDIIFDDPVAIDNCGEVTITWQDSIIGTGDCNEVNGQIYGYDIIRTWIATDECGNIATDTTSAWVLPGFNNGNQIAFVSVPENAAITCGETPAFGVPVCQSACGDFVITFSDVFEENCLTGNTHTRTWTAVDDCGNTATAMQVITVVPDQAPPVFVQVPPDGSFFCNGSEPAFGVPLITDDCSDDISLTYTDEWATFGDCTSQTVTRTWTATDACGNSATASQTLNLSDTDPPVFNYIPEAQTITCGTPVVFGMPEAADACSNVQIDFLDDLVTTCQGNSAITRTWTATDACGNQSIASQTITVEDNQSPVFTTIPPAVITFECGESYGFSQVQATDNCSAVQVSFTDVTEEVDCDIVITRTWVATDACGNSAEISQEVRIVDTEAPVFNDLPVDLQMTQAEFDNWSVPPVSVSDCHPANIELMTETTATCETVIHTYSFIATDECGHATQHDLAVTVTDAVFTTTVDGPAQLDCGLEYDLEAMVTNGEGPYSYHWQVLSGSGWLISSEYDEAIVTVETGTGTAEVEVMVTDANGCEVAQGMVLECEEVATAVDEQVLTVFHLAPNPVSDVLTLRFSSKRATDANLLIINTLGEVVRQESAGVVAGDNKITINVSRIAAGTYLLVADMGRERFVGRFVKILE